jgi:hypothetical protein
MKRAVTTLHNLGALALAIALLFVGAAAADKYHLPLIHGWALAHGSIFIVFPVYFVVSYLVLRPIVRRLSSATADVSARPSWMAILSVILSGFGFMIPMVGSILGIVAGHLAYRRIKASPQLTGSGFAISGLVIGYIGLAYSLYVVGMVSWVAFKHGS